MLVCVMSIWHEKRREALGRILSSLREVDIWNIEHKHDSKQIEWHLLEQEVMLAYDVTRRTAKEWVKEAQELYKTQHDKATKEEIDKNYPELRKEVDKLFEEWLQNHANKD